MAILGLNSTNRARFAVFQLVFVLHLLIFFAGLSSAAGSLSDDEKEVAAPPGGQTQPRDAKEFRAAVPPAVGHTQHLAKVAVFADSASDLDLVRDAGYQCAELGLCILEVHKDDMSRIESAGLRIEQLGGRVGIEFSFDSSAAEQEGRQSPIYQTNTTDYPVPDNGYANSPITISSAPAGALVTQVQYTARVEHTYPGDLWIQVGNDQNSSEVVWDYLGGADDGGLDDDSDSDDDVYLRERWIYSEFDGDIVNQTWYLDVWDDASGDTGTIDYFYLWIYYELASNPPDPDVRENIEYPSTITLGDSAHIQVSLDDNANGDPGTGYITVSFPSMTGSNDKIYAANNGSSSDLTYSEYDRGDSIYHSSGSSMSADYLIVEGHEVDWGSGEKNYLRFDVEPQSTGTFYFYVRGQFDSNGAVYKDPDSSSYTDQQGWPVYRYSITVLEPFDPPDPDVREDISYPSTITIGELAHIEVSLDDNANGDPGTGYITVSFPSMTGSNDKIYAANNGSSSDLTYSEYDRGDSIYHSSGSSMSADYLIVEGHEVDWGSGEKNYLRFDVEPQSTGTFYFYVRGQFDTNGTVYKDPNSSSYTDQQGWPVYRYAITVNPRPSPDISSIRLNNQTGSSITILEGQDVDIEVQAINNGGPTVDGTIQLSFPQLTGADDNNYVTKDASNWSSDLADLYYYNSPLSDDIYFHCPGKTGWFDAEYVLATATDDNWTSSESNTATFTLSPPSPGTYYVYIKSAMRAMADDYVLDPTSSSYEDQQCEKVYRRTITVDSNVRIVDKSISTSSTRDGRTFTLGYQIYSPADTTGWLGASLVAPDGVTTVEDTTHEGPGNEITLNAGTHWYYRDFFTNMVPGAPTGSYDVVWGVHWGTDNFDTVTEPDHLSVLSPIPIRVPILIYHKIGPTAHSLYWVTTDMFRSQMEALKAYGYTAITLHDLMNYRAGISSPPAKPVLITIDDGYENLLTEAYPVLSDSAINFKATSSIITGRVGGTNAWDTGDNNPVINHLSWSQIQTLHSSGLIDFQSHSVTHPDLTSISGSALNDELVNSRSTLESQLNKDVRYLVYPSGYYDATVQTAAREAGYFGAAAVINAIETDSADKWALRRINIDWNSSVDYDSANPDQFFMTTIQDPDVVIPEITIDSIEYLDPVTDLPVSAVSAGTQVKVRVTATNSGSAADVSVSLNIDDDADHDTSLIYDSHLTIPPEDIERTFGVGQTTFDWIVTIPSDAQTGQSYVAIGFHDEHYVLGFRYSGWAAAFDITPPPPVPHITSITLDGHSDDSITVDMGASIQVSISVSNEGGQSSSGLIQASFPELTSSSDHVSVSQGSPWSGDLDYHEYYPSGPDSIWYDCTTPPVFAEAQYVLATAEDSSWNQGEINTATFEFTPSAPGVYRVFVKSAMVDGLSNWVFEPASGSQQDQQCEYVFVRTIYVVGDAPDPSLRIVREVDTGSGYLQEWKSVTVDGEFYRWQVRTAEDPAQRPVGPGPLSEYTGTILAIGALDGGGQPVTSAEKLKAAFIATENAASLAESTFSGEEESIPLGYMHASLPRTDNNGYSYSMNMGLVSGSTGGAGQFLEFNDVSGFDDYDTRVKIWKHIALEAALQNAMFTRTDAGDNGAESNRQALLEYGENVLTIAGAFEDGFALADVIADIGADVTPEKHIDVEVFYEEYLTVIFEDLDNFLVVHGSTLDIKIYERVDRLHKAFENLSNAMSVGAVGINYGAEVCEALILQAVASAQGEESLLVLQALADQGAFADPAAREGISQAVDAYGPIKDSFIEAWQYIRGTNTPIENLDELVSLVEAGMAGGSLFVQLLPNNAAQHIASKFSFMKSNGVKVLGKTLGRTLIVLDFALSIDSTLKAMRQADVALTMESNIKSHLRSNNDFGSSFDSADVQTMLSADQIRYYLQYWHFEKSLNIFNSEIYDFYKIFLLDPIGGLIWFQGIIHSGDKEEAVELYQGERNSGIQNATIRLDKRGRVGQLLWDNLDSLLLSGLGTQSFETIQAVDLTDGPKWVYFEVQNAGAESDNTYVSVSFPEGVTVANTTIDELPGSWNIHPIGGDPIFHRDDTTVATLVPIHTLYEYHGGFPANATHHLGLLLDSATPGLYWLRARVAMAPVGANTAEEFAFVRTPTEGELDQQGWESSRIDLAYQRDPAPVVTVDPSTSFSTLENQAVEIEINVTNNGAASIESYLDISHDDGLEIESITPISGWDLYDVGSLIWHSDGTQHPAQKPLWSRASSYMGASEAQTYRVRVLSREAGNHSLYVRASLRDESMPAGQYVVYPTSGPVDQQGWHVIPVDFDVQENQAPTIAVMVPPDEFVDMAVGDTLVFAVSAVDPDSHPEPLSYFWSLDGETQSEIGTSFNYSPIEGSEGRHELACQVSDGNKDVTVVWEIDVSSVLVGTVIVNPDPDAQDLPWVLTGPGDYVYQDVGDDTIAGLVPGDYTLTWGELDGWITPTPGSQTQTLAPDGTITFSGLYVEENTPPVAVSDSYSVDEGDTLYEAAAGVLSNDTDSQGDPLQVSEVNGDPANVGVSVPLTNGDLTLLADGSFTYDHDGSETTSDSFTYKASDGLEESDTPATVSITVNPQNDPPVIMMVEPDAGDYPSGSTYIITWTDDDPDSDASISLYSDPDTDSGNGNEALIVESLSEDDNGSDGHFSWDTSAVADGSYFVYAVIDDGESPPQSDYSDGVVRVVNRTVIYRNNFNFHDDWASSGAISGYQTTHSEATEFGFSSYSVETDLGGSPLYQLDSEGCEDGKCMKMAVEFNDSLTGGSLDLQFGDPDVPWEVGTASAGYDELWISWRVKHEAGWAWGDSSSWFNLCRFYSGKDYQTEWDANGVLSDDGGACEYVIPGWGGSFQNFMPEFRPSPSCISQFAQDLSAPWPLGDGNWHTQMLHVKMNDVGSSNAVIEVYIDGSLYGQISEPIAIRDSWVDVFTTLSFADYFLVDGAPVGTEQFYYFDDIIISTQQIDQRAPVIFKNGFETGDLTGWSSSMQ